MLACSPAPSSVSAPASSSVRAAPPPLPRPAASATNTSPPAPRTRFERVIEDECVLDPRVEDLGARTLVISSRRVSIVEPSQAWADATDVSAGLPSERGSGSLFTANPIVLQVERQPRRESMFQAAESDYARFRLEGTHWIPLTHGFGASPIALPVASGTVVVGWTHERGRGDQDLVPAGNMTRAWFISSAGAVSDFSRWPPVLTWQQRSTPHTLWAIAARPGQPGQFLLRIPMDGVPQWSKIPGVARCRGVNRLTELARLDEVTDSTATLRIWEFSECIPKAAEGTYRFEHARFVRLGDVTPIATSSPSEEQVTAGQASFTLRDGVVSVVRGPSAEQNALSGVASGSPDRKLDRLRVTAGGREVWVTTRTGPRCAIHRYQWPEATVPAVAPAVR